ncbi:MAG TPA: hypothetical protein VFX61_00020 [Micromonosporaceae bacterium]|nr:hypothetical protein [Micromonosporaceae bacterium]
MMKVLGHSQIGLTMNTYAHVLLEIERATVAEAAKHLFGWLGCMNGCTEASGIIRGATGEWLTCGFGGAPGEIRTRDLGIRSCPEWGTQ